MVANGRIPTTVLLLAMVALTGCSVQRFAINKVGDALSAGAGTYATDDDPELVGGALPFSLKLVESLLASTPRHRGLLTTAASGFTQYAYAFVQLPAEQQEESDLAGAWAAEARARRLYLRARDYGLRGLETRHPMLRQRFVANPRAALAATDRRDVELLYWTAAAWGAAIGLAKDDPAMVSDLPYVGALADRALELDPEFSHGAIHGFMVTWEMVRPGAEGDPAERATRHFRQAVAMSNGKDASPYVAYAESVCLPREDRACFHDALTAALAVDPNANPSGRLANIVMQRRARWLLERTDRLILPPLDSAN